MRLFSFFNKKSESGNAAITMLPVIEPADQPTEDVKGVSVNGDPGLSENKTLTVSYATGWPIDIRIMRRRASMTPWSRMTLHSET